MQFDGRDSDAFWERARFFQEQILGLIYGQDANIIVKPDPEETIDRDALILTGGLTILPYVAGYLWLGMPAEVPVGLTKAHALSTLVTSSTALPAIVITDLLKETNHSPKALDALVTAASVQSGQVVGYAIAGGMGVMGINKIYLTFQPLLLQQPNPLNPGRFQGVSQLSLVIRILHMLLIEGVNIFIKFMEMITYMAQCPILKPESGTLPRKREFLDPLIPLNPLKNRLARHFTCAKNIEAKLES